MSDESYRVASFIRHVKAELAKADGTVNRDGIVEKDITDEDIQKKAVLSGADESAVNEVSKNQQNISVPTEVPQAPLNNDPTTELEKQPLEFELPHSW